MTAGLSILHDIQAAIADGAVDDRGALLRHVTDLFVVGAREHSAAEVARFDDVFSSLVVEMETSARAFLALRLAPVRSAPPNIIRILAFDDDVDVACPILTQSEQLDEPTLVENAETKSQDHLFAISRRRSLSTAITDVLVERGDAQVILSTAENTGARFSEAGFAGLVQRSDGADRLAISVGSRADIPWHVFTTLLAKASDHVRVKLAAEHPHAKDEVGRVVDEVARRMADDHIAALSDSTDVRASLEAMHRSGQLDDEQIRCFAEDGLIEQVKAALCLLSELPLPFIQQALSQDSGETLLVLARANGLSWATVRMILQLPANKHARTPSEIRQCLGRFEKLSRATASEIARFYKARAPQPDT
jgi:uncharacterized protein (DUF2336 family)